MEENHLKVIFAILAGFSPSIITTLFVIVGSDGSSTYWNAAPWIIVTSIPISLITLVIAGVVYAISARKSRSSKSEGVSSKSSVAKWLLSILSVVVLLFVIIPVGAYFWMITTYG
jgi:hypothetical protein